MLGLGALESLPHIQAFYTPFKSHAFVIHQWSIQVEHKAF